MAAVDPEERAQIMAAESASAGDPAGWFERLYAAAEAGREVVRIEDLLDLEVRRWRAEFRRPA